MNGNNFQKFQRNSSTFMAVRAQIDGQTIRKHKQFSTYIKSNKSVGKCLENSVEISIWRGQISNENGVFSSFTAAC